LNPVFLRQNLSLTASLKAISYNGIMPLSIPQKKYLRGLCHDLAPVVTIADKGLSEAVGQEIENALTHHELIKIKIRQDKTQRAQLAAALVDQTRAESVMAIGQVVCLYRTNPNKPASKRITLPKR
jgi:RNA-binding protein